MSRLMAEMYGLELAKNHPEGLLEMSSNLELDSEKAMETLKDKMKASQRNRHQQVSLCGSTKRVIKVNQII